MSKEREKLAELECVPEKMEKEIKDLKRKIKILENRKSEEEEKLAQVMESECGGALAAVRWSGGNLWVVSLCAVNQHLCMLLIQLLVEVIVQRIVTAVSGVCSLPLSLFADLPCRHEDSYPGTSRGKGGDSYNSDF